MKTNMRFGRYPLAWVLAMLVGCGDPTEAELFAAAQAALAKGDHNAALVSYKAVLQKNPQSGQARLALGKAMLDLGDAGAAVVELGKARELKVADTLVLPVLARAVLTEGYAKKVIDDFGSTRLPDPKAQGELAGVVAAASLALGQLDKADTALQEALKAAPDNPETLLVQARLTGARGDADGALRLLDAVIAAKPKDPQPLGVKGELLYRSKHDNKAALAVYAQALAIDPLFVPAHTAIISIRLDERDEPAARKQFDIMRKVRPNHPETEYFAAQFAFLSGDLKLARESTSKLLRYLPDNSRLLQLSGMIALSLNDLQQAETALNKVLQQQPGQASARKLLALTYLRAGKDDKGLALLLPLLDGPTVDVEASTMVANLYLERGDLAKAQALYARAIKSNPQDPSMRAAAALTRLAGGDAEGAFVELQAVADADKSTTADLAIISARMRRGELDLAAKAVAGLERKQPDKPVAGQLAGRLAMLRGDSAGARVAFEKALKADPVFFPAVASLAALDASDHKYQQALERFEAHAKAVPDDPRPQMAMIEIRSLAGASRADTIKALADAIRELPSEAVLRVQLIEQYLALYDGKGALQAARDASAVLPNDPTVLDALGRALQAAGEGQQAIMTFRRLQAMQPKSLQPYLRLAAAFHSQRSFGPEIDALKQASLLVPNDPDIRRKLIEAMLSTNQIPAALEVAKSLQKAAPTSSVGWVLEGDIEQHRKGWPAALAAYRVATSKSRPGDKAAASLHRALLVAKQTAEADAFMASWIRTHPNDVEFMLYRGDIAMLRRDMVTAESRYRDVIALKSDNLAALNNLAWLLASQGKPEGAVFAERAVGQQPDNPSLLDTLALALGAAKQTDRAIEVSKRAISLAPGSPALQLTLAKLYISAGQKPQAREQLDQLAKLGVKFDGQSTVTRLLRSLDS